MTQIQLPSTQSAIVADQSGNLIVTQNAPLPDLQPDELLIKTVAVAINQSDVKMTGAMASPGCIAGGDCAGIIIAVGSAIQAGRFVVGDKVTAPTAFMNPLAPTNGAFAEYVAVAADLALKISDSTSLEEAAALGVGIATIGYALFHSLRIPGHPDKPSETEKPIFVLVYGGSTASGTMAIQLIRRAGLVPITTCSPKNFQLVDKYGAEIAFDYNDPRSVDKIRAYTGNGLEYALDCFCDANGSSMEFCYGALGRAGGRYTTLEPYLDRVALTRKNRVKPDWLLGPALLGKEIGWKEPYHINADPELRRWGKDWFESAQRLLDRKEIEPHPVRLSETVGLECVLDGIETMRRKAVSGEKLVYRIGITP